MQETISTVSPSPELGRARTGRWKVIVLLWLAAFGVTFALDAPVAQLMRSTGIEHVVNESPWSEVAKAPGEFWLIAIVAVLLVFLHPWKWKGGAFYALCAIMSGVNGLAKWVTGRYRPFTIPTDRVALTDQPAPFYLEPFRGGLSGLFQQSNLAFPSGHACLAFASAAALAILLPRASFVFYGAAVVVGLQRIAENAHQCSDVVGAAALGIGGVKLIKWACDKLAPPSETST